MILPPMDTTLTASQPETPAKRRGRYTIDDFDGVARLVARYRLSEEAACKRLGLNYDSFRNWCCRNGNKVAFGDALTRHKDERVIQAIDRIDECGDGIGMKQPDWRAKAFMLQSVLKPEVFGQSGQSQAGPSVNTLSDDTMARLLTMLKASSVSVNPVEQCKQVVDVQLVEQKAVVRQTDAQLKP